MATANLTCPVPGWYTPCKPSCNPFARLTRRLMLSRCGPRLTLAAALCSLGQPVQADLPLTIEDLLTEKGETRLNTSLTYHNRFSESAAYERVPVNGGRVAYVPTPNSGIRENSDILVGTLALRHGITGDTEVYARGSWMYSDSRTDSQDSTSKNSQSQFVDAWVGANYRVKDDDTTLALLGFVEVAALERHHHSNSSFKSWMAGLTTYKAIDPVVFSLTAGYRFGQTRKDGPSNYKPSDFFFLNPSVSFAANDRVTFSAGLGWSNSSPSKRGGAREESRRTSTDVQTGVVYGLSDVDTVSVDLTANASGEDRASVRLQWSHTF